MDGYITKRTMAVLVVLSVSLLGYTLMSVSGFGADPEYDLTIDNIPVNFDDDKTLYLDTQTNDRAFIIYNDHLQVRSSYLTFYELNNSYEHEDVNLVIGEYCYTPSIPAQNATLDTIIPVDRFNFYAWNGTVSVQCSEYGTNRMTLEVNSTDNATLLIRAFELHRNYEYRVLVDDNPVAWLRVNSAQYIEYNYTGDWSNHTITFDLRGHITEVPAVYLNLILMFIILGASVSVIKDLVIPYKSNMKVSPKDQLKVIIKGVLFVAVACSLIVVLFKMFVGV